MKTFKVGQRWQCRDPKFTAIITEIRELDRGARIDIRDDAMKFVCNVDIYTSRDGYINIVTSRLIPPDLASKYQPVKKIKKLNMLKAEDLKTGTILVSRTGKHRKILGICGEVYFLSDFDNFKIYASTLTIHELNTSDHCLFEEPKDSKIQVGQVWESESGERVLIYNIDEGESVAYLPIDIIHLSGKDLMRKLCFDEDDFRRLYPVLSKNQSREIILTKAQLNDE